MARKKNGFWTEEKLNKLVVVFPHKSPAQLVRQFGKPYEVIVSVHEFAILSKKLTVHKKQVTERRDGVVLSYTVTVYAPGFADGIHG